MMDVIINDFSIDGQFGSIGEFEYNLATDILPLLKYFTYAKCVIYKSYSTFNKSVTAEYTLSDLFRMRGSAELQRAKSALHGLIYDEPFWCENKADNTPVNDLHAMFNEVSKRNGLLLSFRHTEYLTEYIELIRNCFSKASGLNHLYDSSELKESYYYTQIQTGIKVDFLIVNNKNYTQEAFDDKNLINTDRQRIKGKLLNLLLHIVTKSEFGDLSKNLGEGLWEFRCDISDTRTFRIFYTQKAGGITFLNGFIKKSQQTPDTELKKARSLAKLVSN